MKDPQAMSFDELLEFRERLVAMIGNKVEAARREVRAQLAQLDSLMSGRRKSGRPHALAGRKIEPKYRGPNGVSWAGRGLMPVWLRNQIKAGRKLDRFAVRKGARSTKAKRGRKKRR